jgi:HAD superfamily hydrolase (TIGR01456 family)
LLRSNRIPFILLTNGGGKTESKRVQNLSNTLSINLDTTQFIQSHTPFASFATPDNLQDKCVLIVGGDGPSCRHVAQSYGFTNAITPGDIYASHPEIWPFSRNFLSTYYTSFAAPLPKPINPSSPSDSLKIDAILIFNDPRDWGLDIQLILDILLSSQGILGTYSRHNGNRSLPNNGYLQDSQPTLYFSNPDLLWASSYHLSRLGQGGFRYALEGVWNAVTGGAREGAKMECVVMGKPFQPTYEYAERVLVEYRDSLYNNTPTHPLPREREQAQAHIPALRRVYMVGDNPESDIRGANTFNSPRGVEWKSILTRTGVYRDQEGSRPSWTPTRLVDDVQEAVEWALGDSGWEGKIQR